MVPPVPRSCVAPLAGRTTTRCTTRLVSENRGHQRESAIQSASPSGAGHRFFDEREAAARRLGFAHATFCAVVRPEDHPRRPAGYRSLDGFWKKRGYRRAEGRVGHFPWPDIGERQESLKPLQFWWRRL
ncbi:hypothetical protein B0684_11135 [Thioalkalivibrio versutus]|nr:hypothetical protein B0684_11135 [Thioalkalivibrio versutus]